MDIDLTLLHTGNVGSIDISGEYEIDPSYYDGTDIIKLSKLILKGKVILRDNEEEELDDYIDCVIEGNMVIPDSISLEEIDYPFNIEYSDFLMENSKKSENILDIFAFLWENILLEVPLQFTKVSDLSKFHGDGWRLLSEEEKMQENNPFNDLLKDF